MQRFPRSVLVVALTALLASTSLASTAEVAQRWMQESIVILGHIPSTTPPPVTTAPNTTDPTAAPPADTTIVPPITTVPLPPTTTEPPTTTAPPTITAPPTTKAPPSTTAPPPTTTTPPASITVPPTPPPASTDPASPTPPTASPTTSQPTAQPPSSPIDSGATQAPTATTQPRSSSQTDTRANEPSPAPVTRGPPSNANIQAPSPQPTTTTTTVGGEADDPMSSDGSVADESESSSSGSEDPTVSSSSSSSSSSLPIAIPTPSPSPSSGGSGSTGESGKRTPTATARTRQKNSAFHDAAVYTGVTVAAVSVALLAMFHVFAFDSPWLDWPHEWLSANGWELLLYVGYVQQIASLSQFEILQTPAFLTQFTDALSWSNFLIQRTNLVGSVASTSERRLATGDGLKGVEAYAERIDISASDMLVNAVIAAAVLVGFLFVVLVALMMCGKKEREDKFDIESSTVQNASLMPAKRRGMLWVLGFLVILWFLVLFPFTALATFELVVTSTNMTLAVTLLVVFCGILLVALGLTIHGKSDEQLMSINRLKVYGALYADVTHDFRWFFVVTALAQIALGVCVGAVQDEATQLTVAIVIVVGYLLTVLLCSPFTSQTPLYFTACVCLLKIVNLSIAFAFVTDKNVSLVGRERAGNAILGITVIVLFLWLLRLLVIFAMFIRLIAERSAYRERPTTPYPHRESVKDNRDASINPILGGSGVYVTIMSPYHDRLGSEYGDSMDSTAPRRTARLAQL